MADRLPTPGLDSLLEAKRQVAVQVVERLLAICQNHEPPIWLSRYINLLNYLRQGRLQDAIFEEARLWDDAGTKFGYPTWVLSRELAKEVEKAMVSLRWHIHYGDQKEPLNLPGEAVDIEAQGTIEEEENRYLESLEARFRLDPIEDDPEFEGILAEVEEVIDETLKDHPMTGGMGFCHVYWEAKKSILKERYGIDWKSPSELNPETIFD